MCNFFIGQPRILTLIFNKYTSHCCFTQKHILNLSIYAISCTYLCQKNAFDRSCTHRYSFFFPLSLYHHPIRDRISACITLLLFFIVAWVATVADTRGQSFRKKEREREKCHQNFNSNLLPYLLLSLHTCLTWVCVCVFVVLICFIA